MFDPQDQVLNMYLGNDINTVVVLNLEEEHLRYSGRDLLKRYADAGLQVIYSPVPDFSAPETGRWDQALQACCLCSPKRRESGSSLSRWCWSHGYVHRHDGARIARHGCGRVHSLGEKVYPLCH